MRKTSFAIASLLLAGMSSLAVAEDVKAKAKAEGEKPTASRGQVVIEEVWWYPLRFDSAYALNNARYHYRRNEEKAAANEVRRSVSWLQYAAGHALPMTKGKLESAVAELTTLAKDLDAGKVSTAAEMDNALARASHALAEWHYYKAKENYGKDQARYAAQNLEAAVEHLKHAANSAHHQFGPDTITMFEHVWKNGKLVTESSTIDNNLLGKHIDGIEKAIKEMANTLKKAST